MSRPTDTERGARIALNLAIDKFSTWDMFPSEAGFLGDSFWEAICGAASDQIAEREALRGC